MMQELTLHVSGMTCMGCANSVKRLLMALDGVQQVDVELAGGVVRLTCDPARVSLQSIHAAIQDGGYQVEG